MVKIGSIKTLDIILMGQAVLAFLENKSKSGTHNNQTMKDCGMMVCEKT